MNSTDDTEYRYPIRPCTLVYVVLMALTVTTWLLGKTDMTGLNIALPVLEPFLFEPDYGFELPDRDAEELGMEGPEDAFVRCILTLREAPEDVTANLLAPIVFCRRTHLARQVVLQESEYPLRRPVFSTLGLAASA